MSRIIYEQDNTVTVRDSAGNILASDLATGAVDAFMAGLNVPQPVPQSVTNFQARAVLMATPGPPGFATLFEAVHAALEAQGGVAWQAWEYANVFERQGALVNSLASDFGLTSAQIDAMFRAADLVAA